MSSLKPLADIKPPQLINFDRQSFVDEVVERIQLNPDWDKLWDGDLYQNASQMILNFFGYMHEKSVNYFNINLSEKFVNHAFSEKAIFENLSDLGIHVKQGTNAYVQVQGALNDEFLVDPLVFDKFHKIYGTSVNNERIPFELITKDENGKYNYLNNIIVNADRLTLNYFNLDAYAGETKVFEFDIDESSLENLKIPIDLIDVEDNSIRVYYTNRFGQYIELPEVFRFSETKRRPTEVFPNGIPTYKITYTTDNKPIIHFGNELFGGRFEVKHIGSQLVVFARNAYGYASNVKIGGINTKQEFQLHNKSVIVHFSNMMNASGGSDAEDAIETKQLINFRLGRDTACIVDEDIANRLHNIINKIKVETPRYGANGAVPFMHAVNYIVPYRDFELLTLRDPDPIGALDTQSIVDSCMSQVNEFCRIQGTHDTFIQNEFVSHFVYPDASNEVNFTYILKREAPLSNSLRATAYFNNQIADYIRWDGNYITDNFINSASLDKITRVRTRVFSTLDIIDNLTIGVGGSAGSDNGKNNKLLVDFDDYGHIFDLTLPLGNRTYKEIAEILNNLIHLEIQGIYSTRPSSLEEGALDNRGAITNMLNLLNHNFVTYEIADENLGTGRLIFNSTRTGRRSKIKFHDYNIPNNNVNYDLYTQLGIAAFTYRPGRETGWVFQNNLTFDYNLNQIYFKIFNQNFLRTQALSFNELEDDLKQKISEKTGPKLSFTLHKENNVLEKLFIGYDINVRAKRLNSITQSLETIGHLVINNVQDNSIEDITNYSYIGSEDITLIDPEAKGIFSVETTKSTFKYGSSVLELQFVDGIESPYFLSPFGELHRIEIVEVEVSSAGGAFVYTPKLDTRKMYYNDGAWAQNPAIQDGPYFSVDISDYLFVSTKNYQISFVRLDNINNVLTTIELDKIIFFNINPVVGTIILHDVAIATTTEVINRTSLDTNIFINNIDTTTLNVKIVNGQISEELNTYVPGWDDFDVLEISYYGKNYDYITVTYQPNIYYPEGEAKGILDLIKDKNNRLIGVEHVIRNVKYVPFGVNLEVSIKKNFPFYDTLEFIKTFLLNYFEFNSNASQQEIGVKPTSQMISNLLLSQSFQMGVTQIFVDPILDDYINANYSPTTYFFILPEKNVDELYEFEVNSPNAQFTNVYSKFKINIIGKISE